MKELKDFYEDIFGILQVMDDIAFKTNMLALNAAVDAAEAGEEGVLFAIAAEEVRILAARSAKAARETAAMIEAYMMKSWAC